MLAKLNENIVGPCRLGRNLVDISSAFVPIRLNPLIPSDRRNDLAAQTENSDQRSGIRCFVRLKRGTVKSYAACCTPRHLDRCYPARTLACAGARVRLSRIQAGLHILSCLEKRHPLFLHKHGLAVHRVSAQSRRPMPDGKDPEAAKLDSAALLHGLGNFLKNSINDPLDVAVIEMRVSRRDKVDEF
jgi:hypothetical protein